MDLIEDARALVPALVSAVVGALIAGIQGAILAALAAWLVVVILRRVWPSPALQASERRAKTLEAEIAVLTDPRLARAALERYEPTTGR